MRAYAEQTMSAIVAHIQDTHTVKKVDPSHKPKIPFIAKPKPQKPPKAKKVKNITNTGENNTNNNNNNNNINFVKQKKKPVRQPKIIQNVSDDEDDGRYINYISQQNIYFNINKSKLILILIYILVTTKWSQKILQPTLKQLNPRRTPGQNF